MTDINLNDPKNLNPSVNGNLREERIKEWNNKPEIRQNNIEAIDRNRYKKIDNGMFNLIKNLAIVGILALVVVAVSTGVYAYIVYKDGTLQNPLEVICGNTTINLDEGICPTCPNCSDVVCGDCNFPNSLKVIISNDTT